MNKEDVFPRRYFYPSLNTLKYVGNQHMTISESISKRELCLPLSASINQLEVDKVASLVKKTL